MPPTSRARGALTLWLTRFAGADLESNVFPRLKIGFSGNKRTMFIYAIDLNKPMGTWKTAW